MFVTLFCGVLDTRTGVLHYSNGGHNLPYMCTPEGVRSVPGTQGTALGLVDEAAYHAQEVVLAPGEVLFLYTDGVTEAMDGTDHLYTEARLEAFLCRADSLPVTALTQAIVDEVSAFAGGAPQSDDLTVLVLRYLGGGGRPESREAVALPSIHGVE